MKGKEGKEVKRWSLQEEMGGHLELEPILVSSTGRMWGNRALKRDKRSHNLFLSLSSR